MCITLGPSYLSVLQAGFPVRLLKMLGASRLLLASTTGSVHDDVTVGDMVLVKVDPVSFVREAIPCRDARTRTQIRRNFRFRPVLPGFSFVRPFFCLFLPIFCHFSFFVFVCCVHAEIATACPPPTKSMNLKKKRKKNKHMTPDR